MTEPLLQVEGLVVGRGTPLLRGISWRIEPGQTWFLLGRNGSGKTTLLATLVGLLPALAGTLRRAAGIADRSRLGFVPQEHRMFPSLPATVAELVTLGLVGLRLDGAARTQRIAAALRCVGLEALAGSDWRLLSLGQRRRVLVARALAREPDLLLLDEPTANLDPRASRQLAQDLEALRQERRLAMLHASHDLELAREFATHVALVHGDRVLCGAAAGMLAAAELKVELIGGR